MHCTLFCVTGSLPTTFIWEFWAIQSLHKQHSVPVSCTTNRIFWLMFLHPAFWYNYATWTNELRTFQTNILIQCFNFWYLPYVLNHHENEPMRFETHRRHQKFNHSINLNSERFVGSCCIRIFWHYGQRKQTFPWLILINLLFDEL